VTTCRCSWLPTINAIQVEGSNGLGYPLTPVENYESTGKWEPAMMLWVLIEGIMGCKDLYKAIAEKRLPISIRWMGGSSSYPSLFEICNECEE
jgi:hypothetical protein